MNDDTFMEIGNRRFTGWRARFVLVAMIFSIFFAGMACGIIIGEHAASRAALEAPVE